MGGEVQFEFHSFSAVWLMRKGATRLRQVILQRVVSELR